MVKLPTANAMDPHSRCWRGDRARAVLVALAIGAALTACRVGGRGDAATFVGSTACADCHQAQYDGWRGSQHAIAMQEAKPGTVLARFDGTSVEEHGVRSTFLRRGDAFLVKTEGTDGRVREYTIRYTFGVAPLQQYLVEFPGGRMQALSLAWDTRPDSAGGQRWFSLNAGRRVAHTDDEHWTGRMYNWNFRCADCHSTAVRKSYQPDSATFRTTYSEISVGCEGCHGPGSVHVRWADTPSRLRRFLWRDDGLTARLDERDGRAWKLPTGAKTALRDAPRATDREIETCAQCHARRIHIADGYAAGRPLLDYYIPALLESDLYYPDGQQQEEVYNYGSFLSSRMYRAGVTCADCHQPHTSKLRRPGAQVCAQCHLPAAYDSVRHHRHSAKSGADCVTCHMTTTTYMGVDPRHDHSMRVPRPDQSIAFGVPNACTQCHVNRDARWAAGHVRSWYGRPAFSSQRFAAAFAADDRDAPGAVDSLARVAHDPAESVIARASALARLAGRPGPIALEAARRWIADPNTLVRLAALQILDAFPPAQRITLAVPLLRDSVRAVRQGAAWTLAPAAASVRDADRAAFDRAATDFVESQRYNADQPDHRLTLGAFYWQLGRLDSAVTEYRAAIALAPRFAQAYVDLAGLLTTMQRGADAERTLRDAVSRLPEDAGMHFALGQLLLREGRAADALPSLREAARLRPDVPEFSAALKAAGDH